jgi:hypothetical protein
MSIIVFPFSASAGTITEAWGLSGLFQVQLFSFSELKLWQ